MESMRLVSPVPFCKSQSADRERIDTLGRRRKTLLVFLVSSGKRYVSARGRVGTMVLLGTVATVMLFRSVQC